MAKPQVSVLRRQRDQAKREKKAAKAERREQRKRDKELGIDPSATDETSSIDSDEEE